LSAPGKIPATPVAIPQATPKEDLPFKWMIQK